MELSTVLEIQIPLAINAHDIKCASNIHEDKPCTCTLVQNEMLLFNEYNGTKVNNNLLLPSSSFFIFRIKFFVHLALKF